MESILVAVAVVLGLLGLDQLGLWAERRGYLYYRHKKASPGSVGSALLQIQATFEPEKRYVLQVRAEEARQEADSGDSPDAGGRPKR